MALVIARKPRQEFTIGPDIKIGIHSIHGNVVRLAIDAPKDLRILRTEVHGALNLPSQEEKDKAVATAILKAPEFSKSVVSTLLRELGYEQAAKALFETI